MNDTSNFSSRSRVHHALVELVPSIKRQLARAQDAMAGAADAVLKAKRPGILSRDRMTCQACRYTAKMPSHLDVHHLDNDHQHNDDDNLATLCHTCHPVQHIGEISHRAEFSEGLGAKTLLASIPEISQADLGLLQRAIGAALMDPALAADAAAIQRELLQRADVTRDTYGTWFAKDFAAAMAQLTPSQYERREERLDGQRLLFSQGVLKRLGKELADDYKALPPAAWARAVAGFVRTPAGGAAS